jgi:chromosome segregation ATPase
MSTENSKQTLLDAIVQLQARVAELEADRVRLVKSAREAWDERAKTQTFATNCQNRAERAEADLATMRQRHDDCAASNRLHTQEKLALQDDLAAARALLLDIAPHWKAFTERRIYTSDIAGQIASISQRLDALAGKDAT